MVAKTCSENAWHHHNNASASDKQAAMERRKSPISFNHITKMQKFYISNAAIPENEKNCIKCHWFKYVACMPDTIMSNLQLTAIQITGDIVITVQDRYEIAYFRNNGMPVQWEAERIKMSQVMALT